MRTWSDRNYVELRTGLFRSGYCIGIVFSRAIAQKVNVDLRHVAPANAFVTKAASATMLRGGFRAAGAQRRRAIRTGSDWKR